MAAEDAFRTGCELFDSGRFFESHEVWEQAWLQTEGQERLFYQGLIQVAAALLHARRGNRVGAMALWAKAAAKLRRFPSPYRQVALAEFLAELTGYFAAVERGDEALPRLPVLSRPTQPCCR